MVLTDDPVARESCNVTQEEGVVPSMAAPYPRDNQQARQIKQPFHLTVLTLEKWAKRYFRDTISALIHLLGLILTVVRTASQPTGLKRHPN